jgi:uncharacterized protein (DUF2236 family)
MVIPSADLTEASTEMTSRSWSLSATGSTANPRARAISVTTYGVLSAARRATYYAETRPIGRAFGVPDALLPADLAAFERYVAEMLAPAGPVRVSDLARELARVVLRPPLAPLAPLLPVPSGPAAAVLRRLPADAYAWTLWPSVGLLPASVRDDYGLSWGPLERSVSGWLVAGWRGWRPVLPVGFRQMPKALAADRRVAGGQ